MSKFEKKLNEAYEKEMAFEDQSELAKSKAGVEEKQTIRPRKRLSIGKKLALGFGIGGTLVLVLAVAGLAMLVTGAHFESHKSVKNYRENFALTQIKRMDQDTFRRINDIEYPDDGTLRPVAEEYQRAVNEFAYTIYEGLDVKEDKFFSPLSLYTHLDLLSHATDDVNIKEGLDELLALEESKRSAEFNNAFLSNRVAGGENFSSIEMDDGAFFDFRYGANPEYLDYLTGKYVECFEMDFQKKKDVSLMQQWAKEKLRGMEIAEDDLGLRDDLIFTLISTLHFKGKWGFNKANTYEDDFHYPNGETAKIPFMHDTFYGKVYQYDDYVSVDEHFRGGYSMQLLVPNKVEDDIFSLVEGRNWLINDESRLAKYEVYSGFESSDWVVKMAIPRFESESKYQFSEVIPALNEKAGKLYEKYSLSIAHAFNVPKENLDYAYLGETTQANQIYWDEEGATATTYTISQGYGKATSAMSSEGVYEINLDQPFLYVSRDRNNLPIYVGRVDHPKKA